MNMILMETKGEIGTAIILNVIVDIFSCTVIRIESGIDISRETIVLLKNMIRSLRNIFHLHMATC